MAKVVTDGKKIDPSSISDLSKEERNELLKALKESDEEEDSLIRQYRESQAKKLANLISTTRAYEERLKSLKSQLKETPVGSESYNELVSQIKELEQWSNGAAKERDEFIKTLEDANQQQIIAQAKEVDVTNRMKASIIEARNKLEEADKEFDEASRNLAEISDEIKNTQGDISQKQQNNYEQAVQKFNTAKKNKAAAERDYAQAANGANYEQEDTGNRVSKATGSMPQLLQDIARGLFSKEHTSQTGKALGALSESVKGIPFIGKIVSGILNVASKIFDVVVACRKTLDKYVDEAANVLANNVGRINAAIEGTGKTYKDSFSEAVEGLGINRFIKQTEYLSQIANLTTRGITFNVEQRALLETIKDKTINSFSSMDEHLLRLVKLTQADVTANQYGLEVALRNTLNKVFKDSTYLQGVYDSIASAITDAVVISGRTDITEYSSVAQTWMGAMYESGIDSSTVNKFANAINYLGSGNVQGLASDADMQRLILLSMDTIGMDYADILQQGLSTSDITDLMAAMVDYLSKIASNTKNNNVLQSSYTQLFGMSMADLQGFKNLQSKMSSLQYVNKATSLSVVEQELARYQSDERVMVNEQISNVFDNAKFLFGSQIAEDSKKYLTWKISNLTLDVIDALTGGESTKTNNIGKGFLKFVGGFGSIGSEIALFTTVLGPLIETIKGIPSAFSSGESGILQTYINGGATMGGSSVSNSSTISSVFNGIKSVNTLESIQGDTFKSAVAKITDRDWDNPEEEKNETLEELKQITSALVVAKADEAHRALATYLVGMTDDTLRSFASIFADENAMQETFEGKNNVLKDNLFNFAGDKTSNSSSTNNSSTNNSSGSGSNSTGSNTVSGNVKTT